MTRGKGEKADPAGSRYGRGLNSPHHLTVFNRPRGNFPSRSRRPVGVTF
jgi:hypothetical protein